MSICAITTGDQECEAVLNYLHLRYFLDTNGNAVCCFEFIVEVKEGNLKYIDLYVPYNIENLEDRTLIFLDERNKPHYNSFEILPVDPNNSCGSIKIEEFDTNIEEVILTQENAKRGSKINVKFIKKVTSKEFRAVRMLFDCNNIISFIHNNKYSIDLRFYSHQDAVTLNLDNALEIQKIKVWVVFPNRTVIDRTTNPKEFEIIERKWDKENFIFDFQEVFWGSKNKDLWKKFPIRSVEWIYSNNLPALIPFKTQHLTCDFTILEPETEKESVAEQLTETGEIQEYARMWTKETGTEGISIENIEKYNEATDIENRSNYEIFIVDECEYERRISVGAVYFKNEPASLQAAKEENFEIEKDKKNKVLEPLIYRILFFTLQERGYPGELPNFIEHCWFEPILAKRIKEDWKKVLKGDKDKESYKRDTSGFRKSIGLVSTILNNNFEIFLRTLKKGKYGLTPFTPTYCLIKKYN